MWREIFFKFRDRFIELAEKIGSESANKYFKVIVLGKFIVGKSTLVNALLNDKIMASKVTAGRGVISEIEYGDDLNNISVIYTDGSEESYDKDELVKERTLTFTSENFSEYKKDGKFFRFEKIHHIEMQSTSKFLKNGIILIDTPELDNARTITTTEFVPKANAIIFTLNATALFSATEREYIAENFAGKGMRNVFFVINRINQLSDDALLESTIKPMVKDYLQEVFKDKNGKFDEMLYNKRVFYVDAYGALCAATNTPYEVLVGRKYIEIEISKEETGFPEFEAALENYHIEHELRKMAKIYNNNTNCLGFRHRNEFRELQNIEALSQMRLLLELAYEAVYGEQPTESDLRELVI